MEKASDTQKKRKGGKFFLCRTLAFGVKLITREKELSTKDKCAVHFVDINGLSSLVIFI
jgi:hypothetical protein